MISTYASCSPLPADMRLSEHLVEFRSVEKRHMAWRAKDTPGTDEHFSMETCENTSAM